MANPITGKVASVISDREVTINKGTNQGVKPGMIFRILDEEPIKITDPDSEEVLGAVQRVKVRVKVISADEEFCIARTYRTRKVNVGGADALGATRFTKMFEPPKYEVLTETLRMHPNEAKVQDAPRIVRRGDLAVQATNDDQADVQTVTTEFR